jgi:hypothetical protein
MIHARKILLGAIILSVIFLVFLKRRSARAEPLTPAQRAKGQCGLSLTKFSDNKYGDGETPPLDPKKCKNKTIGRMKKCYKSDGNKWKKKNTSSCPSWIQAVAWNAKDVREKTAGSPFQRPGHYKKYQNTYFGTDANLGSHKVANAKECATKCTGSDCGGFSMNKTPTDNKYDCWVLPVARVKDGGRVKNKEWHSFAKAANAPTGGAASAGTSGTTTNTAGCKTVTVFRDSKLNMNGETQDLECNKKYEGDELPWKKTRSTPMTGLRNATPKWQFVASETSSMTVPNGMKLSVQKRISPYEGGQTESWTMYGNQYELKDGWNGAITSMIAEPCTAEDIAKGCKL